MPDLTYLPFPGKLPSVISWRTVGGGRAVSSPFTGKTTVLSRANTRWLATFDYSAVWDDDRRAFNSLLSKLRGQEVGLILEPLTMDFGGSVGRGELITNTDFLATISPWVSSDVLTLIASQSFRQIKNLTVLAAVARINHGSITIAANQQYHFMADVIKGKGANANLLQVGTTLNGLEILTGTAFTTPGRIVETFSDPGVVAFPALRQTASAVIGDFWYYDNVTIAPCALVDGAAQVGNVLETDKWPLSTDELMVKDDYFTINHELKQLTENVDSDATGKATLIFEPPIRVSPADNDPIIYSKPYGRFLLQDYQERTSKTFETSYSLEFIEDIGV